MATKPAPKRDFNKPVGLGAGYSLWLKDGRPHHTSFRMAEVNSDGSVVLHDSGKCPGLAYGPGEWAKLEWRGS